MFVIYTFIVIYIFPLLSMGICFGCFSLCLSVHCRQFILREVVFLFYEINPDMFMLKKVA